MAPAGALDPPASDLPRIARDNTAGEAAEPPRDGFDRERPRKSLVAKNVTDTKRLYLFFLGVCWCQTPQTPIPRAQFLGL